MALLPRDGTSDVEDARGDEVARHRRVENRQGAGVYGVGGYTAAHPDAGTVRRKLVHDMREHTVSKAPRPQQPENIRTLAENIIKFNFRFLKDFDMSEWD
jgi:hypothetical protein